MTEFTGSEIRPDDHTELLHAIKKEITTGRTRAVLAANTELIHQYWRIGRQILDRRPDEGWGRNLAADLRTAYPYAKGYSRTNLHRMRALAIAWPEFVPHAVGRIPWGHIVVLLNMLDDRAARDFYAAKTADEGWTRGVLITMIKAGLHLRANLPLHDFARKVPPEDRESVQSMVKDPYVLDFLDSDKRHERDLEARIVENVIRFLQELGTGFAFVGRQYPLSVGGEEFFADLLFYHLKLHRYVVIELRTKGFAPEHVGKLAFHVAVVDGQVRDPGRDEPTVGILLVASRNEVAVEFSLNAMNPPLAVGTYAALPLRLRAALPTPAQLADAITPVLRDDSREDDIPQRTTTEDCEPETHEEER
ncbi:hypothetical protein Pth03_34180 [Planotetraspora thailandica]|uniref:DUF1016 domain-containing protein n=1 Tax=Planotetraspora thailandica TaxID=487172 RepID=A0A8J3UZP4_9ACTN|nr:PDDEXK nuclease domain-containing protein [Planotetraspora thailandica]GII55029.1 hypothetical protein Pth03_34180 [Planotetraspora thailandica]